MSQQQEPSLTFLYSDDPSDLAFLTYIALAKTMAMEFRFYC